MTPVVPDSSALLHAFQARHPSHALLSRLAAAQLHAPHLLDVEFLSGLRGLVRGRKLGADRAQDARNEFQDLRIVRYSMTGLADRIWALRDNVTAYDASYVALAEALDCPLVTSDARLAKTTGHHADVEVYPQG
ncbi:type II toxin-antitoxin system VapC family toxin [Actinomadura sp. DC4]|uniref:type II toxin-antitoxin system VapC family toxin n=1 Tax=Actinomadura sp. DC4 TaxID=3055069 RepID=UPI0025B061EA|nr:type II toxin-antitoxin system VapC family toxin [Actinomadura sp. DC4]MDN3353933.1 type II toxin-antitoxin system VapC family toxin [Actinomadura sp. DC4]